MLKRLALLVATLAIAHTLAAQLTIRQDVMVPMRDGVKLATDVYLPAANERLPVILIRTPYNKSERFAAPVEFTKSGYALVMQDVRGRWHSEGHWSFLGNDGPDGYDTIEWIAKQPWSNGRVAMWGASYDGGVQHAAALERPPHLTTVLPIDAVSNSGVEGMRNHGAFELRFWNWIYFLGLPGSHEARDSRPMRLMFEDLAKNRLAYLPLLPLRAGTTPLKFAPDYESWLVEAMKHGANDEFWAMANVVDRANDYKDIPVLIIGGWYDSWTRSSARNYAALAKAHKSETHLVMGPWTHGGHGRFTHGQVTFGKDAAIADPDQFYIDWFDRSMKSPSTNSAGEPPRAQPLPPVRLFVMGTGDGKKDADGKLNVGGFWRDENEWPLARTKYTDYYFHANDTLSTAAPAESKASITYDFDPKNPVPTIGGNISSHDDLMVQGGWDQRGNPQIWNWKEPIPLSQRPDVVVFQTAPLTEDTEVTGEIDVTLYASSSARDTDFTAKLVDVYPSTPDFPAGFDLNLEDGIQRARFRDSLKVEKLMTPGEIYKFTITMYPTSNVFRKGHRIRVDISSSNFPRFDVNPNTGDPLGENRRFVTATNTIHVDAAHPSHITLPVIPTNSR
jgi:putative CocE/NonD family hydrolase